LAVAVFEQLSAVNTMYSPVLSRVVNTPRSRLTLNTAPPTQAHINMDTVTNRLDKILAMLVDHAIPSVILYQFFSQCVYFISAYLFNLVVQNKRFCTPQYGFKV
jgi:hypothetical protein